MLEGFLGDTEVKNAPADAGDIRDTIWVRKVTWRKAWQPTPVFLPGKSHEQRSMAGYSPCNHKESDMTMLENEIGKQINLINVSKNIYSKQCIEYTYA